MMEYRYQWRISLLKKARRAPPEVLVDLKSKRATVKQMFAKKITMRSVSRSAESNKFPGLNHHRDPE